MTNHWVLTKVSKANLLMIRKYGLEKITQILEFTISLNSINPMTICMIVNKLLECHGMISLCKSLVNLLGISLVTLSNDGIIYYALNLLQNQLLYSFLLPKIG